MQRYFSTEYIYSTKLSPKFYIKVSYHNIRLNFKLVSLKQEISHFRI